MGPDTMAEFRLVGRTVQLIAVNNKFRAGGEGKAAVEQAFSPSLASVARTSPAPTTPERKSFLVDASMLLADIPGYSTRLEFAYRLPYAPDRGNSPSSPPARADEGLTTLTARMHFATPRIPAPPLTPHAGAHADAAARPRRTRAASSSSYVYNFRALPEVPMAAVRHIDPRLGHFMESYTDLDSDLKANPRVHMLTQAGAWRRRTRPPR